MKGLITASVLLISAACAMATEMLIEAESFTDRGGWVVDQQFVHSVGSPYLLAHGMGSPVKDAVTSVNVPVTGAYRVWVRTKNWVPGDWKAPGRFRVQIGGQMLAPDFGTQDGWAWQDGGKVPLEKGAREIRLKDLTGFEGRCDAICLSTDHAFVPPNDLKPLTAWRDGLAARPAAPESAGKFDLVVVGGGIAGCGAAMAAELQGLRVALIQDRPVLGGNASREIRVHTLGIHSRQGGVLTKIDTEHWPNGSAKAIKDGEKRQRSMDATDVTQFLNWRAYGVNKKDNRIVSVDAQNIETGKRLRFEAPVFIDSTGDGWIGYWAGADYRYGRESRDEFDEGWDKHGELWSPEKADNRVMGSSVLWNSHRLKEPSDFPDVPWAMDVAGKHKAINGEWYWEFSADDLHQIEDAEQIRDHMFRAIYGSFGNAKKNPENANVALKWVAYIAGRRESRRLMGDYIYTMKDVTESRQFPDTVVQEKRAIDVHYQRHLHKPGYVDFLSEALFLRGGIYSIPFRCLYSRNVENLMMAGRCFSCSHIGLGGPRVMNTTGQMGIATGYAAALCVQHNTTPRVVGQQHIKKLRSLVGFEGE